MPDYKFMYGKLFNVITDAVEILQQAQRDTEEIFIGCFSEFICANSPKYWHLRKPMP